MERNLITTDKDIFDRLLTTIHTVNDSCPNPTDEQLRGIHSSHAAILHVLGMQLLESCKDKKRPDGRLRLTLKVLAEARSAAKDAHAIKVPSKEEIPLDTSDQSD